MRFVSAPIKIVQGVNLLSPNAHSSIQKHSLLFIRTSHNFDFWQVCMALFALVFDCLVPILPLLTFESIVSHHGRILGAKSIKTHKFQAGTLHLLPLLSATRRPSTLLTRSATLWKNRPLMCSKGLTIKSIPPLLHRMIAQIQMTKWPAQNEIERLRSVPKKPSLVVAQPNLQSNQHVVEVKVELRHPKMKKMVDSPRQSCESCDGGFAGSAEPKSPCCCRDC